MRITRLELKNVGVFDEQVIDFQPKTDPDKAEIHILTGVNGSGKSTILYALASVFTITSPFLQRRFRYIDDRSQITLSSSNSSSHSYIQKIACDVNGAVRYAKDEQLFRDYREATNRIWQLAQKREFEFAAFAYSGTRTLSWVAVEAIKELETNPLSNALNFQNSVDAAQLIQWIANTRAKVAFARQDNQAQIAKRYQDSLKRIEDAVTEIVGYPVEFIFRYDPLVVRARVNKQELEFDLLPDGLKSIISWIADLLMRLDRIKWVNDCDVLDRNFILFLDEIEIHLHPTWQRRILPVIQKLFKNAQIFIATHSPFVVASVSDAWVYRFNVRDGKSQLALVEESKAGSSYATVIDEIFGIEEFFDVETEKEFQEFERLKQELLCGNKTVIPALTAIAQQLSSKSVEVQDIVGRELRQLQRITKQDIPL
jgi:predicted ATP-binding protein involved in virulence